MSTKSRTYRSEYRARACEEMGAVHLVYTDTIHEDCTVTRTVRGTSDGEYINSSKTEHIHIAAMENGYPAWGRIHRSRLSTGWTLVGEETSPDDGFPPGLTPEQCGELVSGDDADGYSDYHHADGGTA